MIMFNNHIKSLMYFCKPFVLRACLSRNTGVKRVTGQLGFSTTVNLTPQSEFNMKDYLHCDKTIEQLNKKGISQLFPIQIKTYQIIYKGYDLIASDRTGSGKTLAFALPVIERMRSTGIFENKRTKPKFLIMAPTRELAVQISRQILSLMHSPSEIRVATLIGGSDLHEQRSQLTNYPHIIVATPGRFLDFYNRGNIELSEIEVLCIDEADMMLERGFKVDIETIMENIHRKTSQPPQHLLFSATMPKWVTMLTQSFMRKDKKQVNMIGSKTKTPSTVIHEAVGIEPEDRIKTIHYLIKQHSKQGLVLIFTAKKIDADFLSKDLKVTNCVLHGDIKQSVRELRLQAFKSRKVKILIATDVASRGLDIPDVELVIQNNPPAYSEAYVHRSGRTGRAGKPGRCITIYNKNNLIEKQSINKIQMQIKTEINQLKITEQQIQKIEQGLVKQSIPHQIINDQQNIEFHLDRLKLKLSKTFKYINYQAIKRQFIEKKGLTVQKITKSINKSTDKSIVFLLLRGRDEYETARKIDKIMVTGVNQRDQPEEELCSLTRVIKFRKNWVSKPLDSQ